MGVTPRPSPCSWVMTLELWRTGEEDGEREPQPELGEDIDTLNNETFGDDITGDWEPHHYSSVVREELPPPINITRPSEPHTGQSSKCNGSKDGTDNITQFEKLGLKDLWDSSPNMSSPLESIWTPSALPHPPTVAKTNSPIHMQHSSSSSTGSSKVNVMNVSELEKTMLEHVGLSSSPPSPPHSPTALLPSPFHNLQSPLSHSPSPPPPPPPTAMGFFPRPHPPPYPFLMYPPPGLHMVRPHPHQRQPLLPQARVPPPPYFGRGPIPPGLHNVVHHLPPNIPLMGPPRLIPGYPRPPLLIHPSQMVPRPRYHEGPRPFRHYSQPSANPNFLKLSEMLSDLKPDGSGFMSKKEKEWVIKVQLMQLHTTSPEIEDYYYQKYIHNKYKSDKEEGVVRSGDNPTPLTLPPPVSREDRKDRPRSEFEGTLGKVSVGSVTAPRKTIDVVPSTVSNEGRKEALSRKRQALVTIETMYTLLLKLDDLHSVTLADDDSCQSRKQILCNQLYSLLDGSDFQQLMSYRKGKHLYRRLLPYLDEEKSKATLLTFSKNLIPILKKDVQDKVLMSLLPALSAVVNIFDITEVQKTLLLLQPLLSSKYTNNKFFVEFFGLLVNKGNQFVSSGQQVPDWTSLLSQLNSLFTKSKLKSDTLAKLLAASINE